MIFYHQNRNYSKEFYAHHCLIFDHLYHIKIHQFNYLQNLTRSYAGNIKNTMIFQPKSYLKFQMMLLLEYHILCCNLLRRSLKQVLIQCRLSRVEIIMSFILKLYKMPHSNFKQRSYENNTGFGKCYCGQTFNYSSPGDMELKGRLHRRCCKSPPQGEQKMSKYIYGISNWFYR